MLSAVCEGEGGRRNSWLAAGTGQLTAADRDRILQMLRTCSVPTHNPLFTREFFKEAMKDRVANSMGQRVPLPVGIGEARIFNDVNDEAFEEAFVQWEALCATEPQPPRGPMVVPEKKEKHQSIGAQQHSSTAR